MKKLVRLFLTIMLLVVITACGKKNKVTSINIVSSSIPDVILVEELDSKLSTIKMQVTKGSGDTEEINLNKSMLSEEDYNKISQIGTYTVTVNYEGQTTALTLNLLSNNYIVKVVYPTNEPVTEKVSVQWCSGENCFLPKKVNECGLAEIKLEDGNYYIHIDNLPDGYTYDPNAYTTSKNNKFVEIKLIKLNSYEGLGTSESPYVLSTGAYTLTYDTLKSAGQKYYTFTPNEAGTYNIKSMAMDKLAINNIDPYLGFLGTSTSMNDIDVNGNIEGNINFNYTFEAKANVTYTFIIFVSSADKTPASFDIVIELK